jgi:NitT/TauT family transport system permease protein
MRRLVNQRPGPMGSLLLGALPFLLVAILYVAGSKARLAENPDDRLLPAVGAFVTTLQDYAVNEDLRSGQRLLWADTKASLARIGIALALAAALGFGFGLAIGALPQVGATLGPFTAVLSMIPPLAVLPILFIVFGLGEVAKVVLIVIGIAPVIARDLAQRAQELPQEQLIKAQTLGASSWQLVVRVIGPQLLPRLVDALRLSLGAAWLFLISAEAIAADVGLGYRIFLVRRYMAMDVILPYVAWITLLASATDFALAHLARRWFRWTAFGQLG